MATFGWHDAWSLLSVDTLSVTFGDIRLLQGAVISMDMGLDPRIENPGFAKGTLFNHPPIWLAIGEFLQLDREQNFLAFVLIYLALFLLSLAKLISMYPSVTLLLASISGAVCMAIERGNNDVVVFLFVFGATLSARRFRAPLLLIAAILKLYPFAAFVSLVPMRNMRDWKAHLILLAVVTLFFAYLVIWHDQISRAVSATEHAYVMSFGVDVIARLLVRFAPMIPFPGHAAMIVTVLIALVFIVVADQLLRRPLLEAVATSDNALMPFVAGGAIYSSAYLAFNNWDYRLIFLLLTIPFVLREARPVLSIFFAASLLIALNQFLLVAYFGSIGGLLNVGGKAAVHAIVSGILIRLLLAAFGLAMVKHGASSK